MAGRKRREVSRESTTYATPAATQRSESADDRLHIHMARRL